MEDVGCVLHAPLLLCVLGLMNKMTTAAMTASGRTIDRVVRATKNGPSLLRLVGTVDIDGKGVNHPLPEAGPCILLDSGTISKNHMPPFGVHPHRGHSVVTILLQGKMQSFDSFQKTKETLSAPASYWVDAGSGVFHDEISIIENEEDPLQHVKLFQLWVGVSEEDRSKPARVQFDGKLPSFDCLDATADSNKKVGKGMYYVGEQTSIETPHPITVAYIQLDPGATYHFPIDNPAHEGFVVHVKGGAGTSYGGTQPEQDFDVIVLSTTTTDPSRQERYLEVITGDTPIEFLICVGERIQEPWCKKLAANGAIIAKTPEEARSIGIQVEELSKKGKEEGSFAPFGS